MAVRAPNPIHAMICEYLPAAQIAQYTSTCKSMMQARPFIEGQCQRALKKEIVRTFPGNTPEELVTAVNKVIDRLTLQHYDRTVEFVNALGKEAARPKAPPDKLLSLARAVANDSFCLFELSRECANLGLFSIAVAATKFGFEPRMRDSTFAHISRTLVRKRQFIQADKVSRMIADPERRDFQLIEVFRERGDCDAVLETAKRIQNKACLNIALMECAMSFIGSNLDNATRVISAVEGDSSNKSFLLKQLCEAYIRARNFIKAKAVADTIPDPDVKESALKLIKDAEPCSVM